MSTETLTTWTAESANRALPLVRRIVADLVARYADWQHRIELFELAATRSTADEQDPGAERLEREAQLIAVEIQGFVRELEQVGVQCKSLEHGLVDFPGELDGRPVLFCWKHGEAAVTHWHDPDAGFAGRQPLPDTR